MKSLAVANSAHSTASGPREDAIDRNVLILAFCLSCIPGLLNYLQVPHVNTHGLTPQGRTSTASLTASLLQVALGLTAIRSIIATNRQRLSWQTTAAPLVIIYIAVGEQYQNTSLNGALDSVTAILVTWALALSELSVKTVRLIGWLGSGLALVAAIFGAFAGANAFYVTETGAIGESVKAFIGHNQLAGPFGQSNTLGIALALILPFTALMSRWHIRFGARFTICVVIFWSASRTSLYAIALGAALLVFDHVVPRSTRKALRASILTVLASFTVALPLTVSDPESLTRRVAIWQASLHSIGQSWLVGLGQGWYTNPFHTAYVIGVPASSGHNLFVSSLTQGGLIEAFLFANLFYRIFRLCLRDTTAGRLRTHFLSTLLLVCCLEFPFTSSARSDLFFFTFCLCVCLLRTDNISAHSEKLSDGATP